ncbi:hypothetical protein D3C74_433560 [compost metagenome]
MHFRKFHHLAHSFWQSAAKAIFLLFYRITIEIHIQHLHKKAILQNAKASALNHFEDSIPK